MRKIIFPILLGIVGCAILLALGVWQLQRLQWKTAVLAEIDTTISAPAVAIPNAPNPDADQFKPVTVTGRLAGKPLYVLVTIEGFGPGYRYVDALKTDDGRDVMVDLGWVPLEQLGNPFSKFHRIEVVGNLHWPDDLDKWTPDPDPKGIWFTRDVPSIAAGLASEEVLIVARNVQLLDLVTPLETYPFQTLPLDSGAIKNDHLNYAITWFMLALVWVMMTGYLIFRIRQEDR
ncbi:surfeit locus 1 family protein [Loktanella ponticola]|uniref:SURF1-like protein n=1 Tax=Yoonia ponticola TaxID=1524255 RepID=A0A7W9BLE8_9RHOB|nr:SURF1 family protein [Yoonia ponticola]MBB5722492.1 surfeit locus 1 family protein [Yoonia ponticola]